MKKRFLKTLVILLAAALMLWISLLHPGQSVEARTSQPALASQTIVKQARLNLQGVERSLLASGDPTAVMAGLISVLKVQTIPATAGIHFKLGELSFVSGQDGTVMLPMNSGQNYSVVVDPSAANSDTTLYEFNCWSDVNSTDKRTVSVTNDKAIQVGFNVYNKVGMTFKDSNGSPVDPARVTLITLQSGQGEAFSFSDGQPRWLLASVINRQTDGLRPENVQYSLTNVIVDGSNVVDQSKQAFFAHPGESWPLTLQLFSVHITARDAIYQNPVGSGVALEYPNGQLQTIPFSANKDVTIAALGQGSYHVQVTGVSGIASYTPIELSQNQEVDLMLPTQLDMLSAFAAGILFALAMLFVGRAWLLRLRSKGTSQALDRSAGDFPRTQYSYD